MQIVGLKTAIWSNRLRSAYLITLMPLVVFLVVLIGMMYSYGYNQDILIQAVQISIYSLPVLIVWLLISILFHRKLIFSQVDAVPITRQENPYLYNIVENIAISRGLPVPRIGIMNDDSLNAFATGWSKKNSRVVFSRGLIEKLNKEEIEAVAAHEMTHIMNEDVKIMLISTLFIGIVGTVGEILLRSRLGDDSKDKSFIFILGIMLYITSLVILPLINLAISRKREYLADAGSVELTKNKEALISALTKISEDSIIEAVEGKGSISAMCIFEPTRSVKGLSSIKEFFSTHPSIENRIALLQKY